MNFLLQLIVVVLPSRTDGLITIYEDTIYEDLL